MNTFKKFIVSILTSFILITGVCYASPQKINADEEIDEFFPKEAFNFLLDLDPSSDCGLVKTFTTIGKLASGLSAVYSVYSLVDAVLSAIGVFPDPEAAFRQQVKEKLDRITLQVDTINSRLTNVESTLINQFAEVSLQNKALHAKELANQNTSFINNVINVMDGYMRPLHDSVSISLDEYADAVYSGDFDIVQDINVVLNSKDQTKGSTYVKNIGETVTIPAEKIIKAIKNTSKGSTTKESIKGIFREFYHQEFGEGSYCYYPFKSLYNWLARKYVENGNYSLLERVGHEPSVQKFFKEAYESNNLTGNMSDLENEFVDLCYEGMCNFFTKEYFSEGEGTRKSLLGKIDTVFNNYYKAIATAGDSPIEREYSIIKDTYAFQGDLIYSYNQYVEKDTYKILSQNAYDKLPSDEKANYTKETVNVNQIKDIHDYYYTLTAVYATFTISAYKACDQLNRETLISLIDKWNEMNKTIDNSFNSMAKRDSNGDYAMNYCYLVDSLVDFKTISSKASLKINYHEGGFFNNLDVYDNTEKSDWSKEYTNDDIVTSTNLKQLYVMCNANKYGSNFKTYLSSRNIKFTSDTNLLLGSEIQSRGLNDDNLNQHVYSWCVLASEWFEDYKYTTLSGNGHGTGGLDSSYRLGAFADAMNMSNGAVESGKLLASAAAFHESRKSANDAMCIFYPGELEGKQVAKDVCGTVSSSSNSYISVLMNIGKQYGALFKVNETKNGLLKTANPFTSSQYDKQDQFHISLIDKINETRNNSNYVSYYYDETTGSIPYWINVDKKYLDNTSKVNDQILNQTTDYLLDNVDTIASEYNSLEATYRANNTFKDELLKVDLSNNEINRIANAVINDYVDEVVNKYSDLPKRGDENKFYYCISDKTVYGYNGGKYIKIAKLGEDKLLCYYNANSTLDTKDDEVIFIEECAKKKDIGNDKNIAYYCLEDHRIYYNKQDITSKVNNIDNTKESKHQLDCPDITKTYYVSDKFYNINLTAKSGSVYEDVSNVVNVQKVSQLPTISSDKYYYVLENGKLYHKSADGLSYENVDFVEANSEIANVQIKSFYQFNGKIYSVLEDGNFIEVIPSSTLPQLDTSKVINTYGNYYLYNGSIWQVVDLMDSENEPVEEPEKGLDGYIYNEKAYLWNESEYSIKDCETLIEAYLYCDNAKYYVLDYAGLKQVDVEVYENNYTDYIIKLNGCYYRYTDANSRVAVTSLLPTSIEEGKIIRDYNLIDDKYNFYIYSSGYNQLDYETIFSINSLPKPNNADITYLINNEFKMWGITDYVNDTRYIVASTLPESFDATKTYIIGNTLYTYDYSSSYIPDSVADLTFVAKSFNCFEKNARKVEGIIYKVGDVYYSYYKNFDAFVPYGMFDFGTIEELPIVNKNNDLALMYKLDFHLMVDINIDEDGNISHKSKPVFNIYPLLTWTDDQTHKHRFEVLDSELEKANVTCGVKVPIVEDDDSCNTAATNHYVSMMANDKDILKERLVNPVKGSKTNRYTEVYVKSFSPFMISELSKLLPYTLPKTGVVK